MRFYTNVSQWGNNLLLREVIDGKRINRKVKYSPTLYCPVMRETHFKTLEEEIFGPVLTIYVYENEKWNETLELIDNTSPYALTGCVFSENRDIVNEVRSKLRFAAGNFYVNDKPTGAVVGQQPFGGSRASGTNDKGGSMLNLLRWTSPRTIKETFEPPQSYKYPYMDEE